MSRKIWTFLPKIYCPQILSDILEWSHFMKYGVYYLYFFVFILIISFQLMKRYSLTLTRHELYRTRKLNIFIVYFIRFNFVFLTFNPIQIQGSKQQRLILNFQFITPQKNDIKLYTLSVGIVFKLLKWFFFHFISCSEFITCS